MNSQKKNPLSLKRQGPGYSPTGRKTRKDQGQPRLTQRDWAVLTWIGQQYAMRLDQVQTLLGWSPGYGAAHQGQISEQSARSAIARWTQAGWVVARRIDTHEPLWVWLTKKGLTLVHLPYQYHSLDALSKHDRDHLYAITSVRLLLDGREGVEWTSERTMLQGTHRRRGYERVHRPDAVMAFGSELIAIEVELSQKTPALLSHIVSSLLQERDYHGHAYHALKAEKGEKVAQELSVGSAWRRYTRVYYFAERPIRRYIRRVLAKLVLRGEIREDEAERISVWWYPLAVTNEELAQQAEEAAAPLNMDEEEDGERVFKDRWEGRDA